MTKKTRDDLAALDHFHLPGRVLTPGRDHVLFHIGDGGFHCGVMGRHDPIILGDQCHHRDALGRREGQIDPGSVLTFAIDPAAEFLVVLPVPLLIAFKRGRAPVEDIGEDLIINAALEFLAACHRQSFGSLTVPLRRRLCLRRSLFVIAFGLVIARGGSPSGDIRYRQHQKHLR